jgi:hypothetical protein
MNTLAKVMPILSREGAFRPFLSGQIELLGSELFLPLAPGFTAEGGVSRSWPDREGMFLAFG